MHISILVPSVHRKAHFWTRTSFPPACTPIESAKSTHRHTYIKLILLSNQFVTKCYIGTEPHIPDVDCIKWVSIFSLTTSHWRVTHLRKDNLDLLRTFVFNLRQDCWTFPCKLNSFLNNVYKYGVCALTNNIFSYSSDHSFRKWSLVWIKTHSHTHTYTQDSEWQIHIQIQAEPQSQSSPDTRP